MKYNAFIVMCICLVFVFSCSVNTEKMLIKIEDHIYTGYYQKAEQLMSRLDTGKMDEHLTNEYLLLKGYLKCEQGYWGMAKKILETVKPLQEERASFLLQIVKGFLSLYTGDTQQALSLAKGIYHSLFKEQSLNSNGLFKKYDKIVFLLYRLFIECYRQAGDRTLQYYYLNELAELCEAHSYAAEKDFFNYYHLTVRPDSQTHNTLFTRATDESLPLIWRIRAGLFALETGVFNREYMNITDAMTGLLTLAQTHHHDFHTAKFEYFFGCIEKENNRWAGAVDYFIKSKEGFKRLQNISAYHISLYQYGISLYHNGMYLDAKEVLEEAEGYYRDSDQEELYAELSVYLGSLYKIVGHFKQAENSLIKAYMFYSENESEYKEKIIECLMNLGVVTMAQLEYDRALDYFNRIEPYLEPWNQDSLDQDSIHHAYLYNNRGQIYKKTGNEEKALSEYLAGLSCSPPESEIRARILLNMADCYYSRKKEDEAVACLSDAEFITQNEAFKKLSGEILYFQGRINLDRKEYEKALEFLTRAGDVFSLIGDLKYRGKALYSMSIAYRNNKEYDRAITCLEQAADIFDTINLTIVGEQAKTEFRKEYGFVLKDLINILFHVEEYEKAFFYVEKTKARNLLENLSENDFKVSSLIPPELAQKRQQLIYLKNNLSQHYFSGYSARDAVVAHIKKIDEELAYIKRQIELQVPEAVALEGASVLTAGDVMAGLENNDIILEYEIAGNSLYLFTLTKEKLSCYSLTGKDKDLDQYLLGEQDTLEIESLAYRYQGMLKDYTSSLSDIKAVGKQLFQKLMENVYDDAVKKTNWIIVPDKKLFYLPFAALVNKNGQYLIEENIQISYSHSAAMYIRQKTRQRETPDKSFLFFALPDYFLFSNWGQDAREIRDSYPEAVSFFNTDARESTLRTMDLTPYKTIQFLLHGFTYDTFDHLNSNGLMFHESELDGYDGYLILEEIFNLKMNPDLLILTACSSGLGKQIDGEGLYGMNHAFFYAGARSILSTLWNVYIVETNRFSIILGKMNARDEYTSKEAVIKAQKQLFVENSHPVYWAPFVLFGHGG